MTEFDDLLAQASSLVEELERARMARKELEAELDIAGGEIVSLERQLNEVQRKLDAREEQ